MKSKEKIVADCPSCGEIIYFDRQPKLAELVSCWYCEEELEVIGLEPVLLDFPFQDEDYDDEDYDDEGYDTEHAQDYEDSDW